MGQTSRVGRLATTISINEQMKGMSKQRRKTVDLLLYYLLSLTDEQLSFYNEQMEYNNTPKQRRIKQHIN